jgi:hypothetical protein
MEDDNMRGKAAKAIRRLAFGGMSGQEERQGRGWMLAEIDKKGHKIILCLDPRAIYLNMKGAFKRTETGKERAEMIKSIKLAYHGPVDPTQRPTSTYLGHQVNFSGVARGGVNDENVT